MLGFPYSSLRATAFPWTSVSGEGVDGARTSFGDKHDFSTCSFAVFRSAVAANSMPYVLEGKLRALAVVGSEKRLEKLPHVQTLSELGYPALNIPGWTGVVVRTGTPTDVMAQLHSAVAQAVQSDEIKRRFGDLGVVPAPQSSADFARFIQTETDRWGSVIRSAGVVLE